MWGLSYLMCPPNHFDVTYSINPWMRDEPVDRDTAHRQWQHLTDTIRQAGGTVHTLPAQRDLPDMVFTANAGVLAGDHFIPSRMAHPEREAEPKFAADWMAERGMTVGGQTFGRFEGAGDALPFGNRLVAGYGQRSDLTAWREIEERYGWRFTPIELPDPRFYHIDLVFCPLDDRRAIVAPIGLGRKGLADLISLVDEPIILTDDEATRFAANSIVVDRTVIMPYVSPRLGRALEEFGFQVVEVDVGEFQKAGGAVRCMTLATDVGVGEVS